MGINPCLLWLICYILYSDWSLLLVNIQNIQGSFHVNKVLLETCKVFLQCTQGSFTFYNFLCVYMKQNLQLPMVYEK